MYIYTIQEPKFLQLKHRESKIFTIMKIKYLDNHLNHETNGSKPIHFHKVEYPSQTKKRNQKYCLKSQRDAWLNELGLTGPRLYFTWD